MLTSRRLVHKADESEHHRRDGAAVTPPRTASRRLAKPASATLRVIRIDQPTNSFLVIREHWRSAADLLPLLLALAWLNNPPPYVLGCIQTSTK